MDSILHWEVPHLFDCRCKGALTRGEVGHMICNIFHIIITAHNTKLSILVYRWTFCFPWCVAAWAFISGKWINLFFRTINHRHQLRSTRPFEEHLCTKTVLPTGLCTCNFNYNFASNRTFLVLTSDPVTLGSPPSCPSRRVMSSFTQHRVRDKCSRKTVHERSQLTRPLSINFTTGKLHVSLFF